MTRITTHTPEEMETALLGTARIEGDRGVAAALRLLVALKDHLHHPAWVRWCLRRDPETGDVFVDWTEVWEWAQSRETSTGRKQAALLCASLAGHGPVQLHRALFALSPAQRQVVAAALATLD